MYSKGLLNINLGFFLSSKILKLRHAAFSKGLKYANFVAISNEDLNVTATSPGHLQTFADIMKAI